MEFLPSQLSQPDRYKLMIGGIVPRPIAVVSTVSADGRPNVAPFSFFNGVGSDPMMLLFCPANKPDGSDKDTLRNCAAAAEGGAGEFVVNILHAADVRRIAACAEPLEYGDSEFALSGLTPAPSTRVRPPRVAEAALSFECRTVQVIRTNPGAPSGGNVVLGEVVYIHAADGLVNERFHVDPVRLDAVGRMGGIEYCNTRERFQVPMGRAALQQPPG
ncbi:MAG: hypothetical protein AMXMBFR58_00500 [Phycisphaerae bacterium]|nr:hypothetical protein [Phycisphaerales bacterium]